MRYSIAGRRPFVRDIDARLTAVRKTYHRYVANTRKCIKVVHVEVLYKFTRYLLTVNATNCQYTYYTYD